MTWFPKRKLSNTFLGHEAFLLDKYSSICFVVGHVLRPKDIAGNRKHGTCPSETYNIVQEKRKQINQWINKFVSTNVKGKDQNKSWMMWLESNFGKEMNKLQRQKKPTYKQKTRGNAA